MVVVVFRFKPNPAGDAAAFQELGLKLYEQVISVPGFISIREYQSGDGEILNLVEFDSMEAVETWKNHPEHRRAKQRAREFMSEYNVQVCNLAYSIS
jgi:heme-degrading monooxygenase HmoA